jgi:hypothetical protein
MEEDIRLNGEKPIEDNNGKDEKGLFTKGNKYGSFPRKLTLAYLTRSIRQDEKLHPNKKRLLEHYKERLLRNDNLLAKFMDKYLPTLNNNEVTGKDGSPLTFIIEKTYEQPKGENGK